MSINVDIRSLAIAGIVLFLITSGWNHPVPPVRKHPSIGKLMTMTKKSCQDSVGNVGLCMFKWDCISYKGITLSTCVDGFLFGACCTLESRENLLKNDSLFAFYNIHKEYLINTKLTTNSDTTVKSTAIFQEDAANTDSTVDSNRNDSLFNPEIKNDMSEFTNFTNTLSTDSLKQNGFTKFSNFKNSLEDIITNDSLMTPSYDQFGYIKFNNETNENTHFSNSNSQNFSLALKPNDEHSYSMKINYLNNTKNLSESILGYSSTVKVPSINNVNMDLNINKTSFDSSNNRTTITKDQLKTQFLSDLNVETNNESSKILSNIEEIFDLNDNVKLVSNTPEDGKKENIIAVTKQDLQDKFDEDLHRTNYNNTSFKLSTPKIQSTFSSNYTNNNIDILDSIQKNSHFPSKEDMYSEWLTSTKYMSSSLANIIKQLTLSTFTSLSMESSSNFETSTIPFNKNNLEFRDKFSVLEESPSKYTTNNEAIVTNLPKHSEFTSLKEDESHETGFFSDEMSKHSSNENLFDTLNYTKFHKPSYFEKNNFTSILNQNDVLNRTENNMLASQPVQFTFLPDIDETNTNVSLTDYLIELQTEVSINASTISKSNNTYPNNTSYDISKSSTLETEIISENVYDKDYNKISIKNTEVYSPQSDITSPASTYLFDENDAFIPGDENMQWTSSTKFSNVFEIINNHAAKSSTQSFFSYDSATYSPNIVQDQNKTKIYDESQNMKNTSEPMDIETKTSSFTVIPQNSVHTMNLQNFTPSTIFTSTEINTKDETEYRISEVQFSNFQTPSQKTQFEATDNVKDMYLKTEYKNSTEVYFDEFNTLTKIMSEFPIGSFNLDEDIETMSTANVDLSTVHSSYLKNNFSSETNFVSDQDITTEKYMFNQTSFSGHTLFSAPHNQNFSFSQSLQNNITTASYNFLSTNEVANYTSVPLTTLNFIGNASDSSTTSLPETVADSSLFNNISVSIENVFAVNIPEMHTINISSNEIVSENVSKQELTFEPSTTINSDTTQPLQWNYKKDCGVRLMKPIGRIVGGKNTHFGKWPWQALVKETTWLGLFVKNKCGGVLITSKYVLTAAHCQPGFLASLVVVLGIHDLGGTLDSKASIVRNVRRMVIHRHYNAQTFENDLALLEMESSVEFLPHIVPICLPHRNEDFTGKMAFVTGWGKLTHGGDVPNILQEVQVPIVKNGECQRMFYHAGHKKAIRSNFVCAGYTNGGQDSCEGDSGGPLMVQRSDKRWVLVGTVSHGIGCADPNLPGVYMRMSSYRPWIDSIIKK